MSMVPATLVNMIIGTYYTNISEELHPDFHTNRHIDDIILPPGYSQYYTVMGIYRANDNVYDKLASENLQEILIIRPVSGTNIDDIAAIIIDNKIYNVIDDIINVLSPDDDEDEGAAELTDEDEDGFADEYEDDWSEDAMLAHGAALYDAYGPDVDTMDFDDYDAACYLSYKRQIGEA